MNDYEAHLSSYDHSHKQRLKDMKAMVRDPNAGARARKAEAKAGGLVSIKLASTEQSQQISGAGGFKKGVFKKSGFKSAFTPVESIGALDAPKPSAGQALETEKLGLVRERDGWAESDTEDEDYEMYDPGHPTD